MTKKYMLIELLHKKLIDYLTIININDEIYFINELKKADIDDIRSNIDKFISILEQLQISHQDNGIFEVNIENTHIFFNFVFWIREIQNKLEISLDKYTDGFGEGVESGIVVEVGHQRGDEQQDGVEHGELGQYVDDRSDFIHGCVFVCAGAGLFSDGLNRKSPLLPESVFPVRVPRGGGTQRKSDGRRLAVFRRPYAPSLLLRRAPVRQSGSPTAI